MKNTLKVFMLSIITLSIVLLPINIVKADSDWGTDYDSGWSSSDSDWSSSDYGWSSNDYDSAYSGSDEFTDADFILIMIIIVIIIIAISNNNNNKGSSDRPNGTERGRPTYSGMTDDEISKIDSSITKDELLKKCFEIYQNVQIAWMNYDFETLEKLQTDEIYNNQKMKLETLKMKKQKNVMENIQYVDGEVRKIVIYGDKEVVTVAFTARMRDYVINTENQSVVRGNKQMMEVDYEIKYIRNIGKEVKFCPSCGAEVKNNSREKCEYCDSIIVKTNGEFVLSDKKNINQRRWM